MYAFKKSGVEGDYDVIDELDLIEYAESLPQLHEPIDDLDGFKHYSAQYFTPSDLKDGLTRRASNIKNIQGIIFDLDRVVDWNELMMSFYQLLTVSRIEMYLWQTPSALSDGGHSNGSRIYVPLDESIQPQLLTKAVDELVITFAQAGLNLLEYGVDLTASKTVGRLMGLPLQKKNTIVPWDMEERFRYHVKAKYEPSEFVSTMDDGFSSLNEPTVENLSSFIAGYVEKHQIGFAKGERDNNLTKVYGALNRAFNNINPDDLLAAFYEAGIAQTLDHPDRDISNKSKRLLG